MTRTFKQRDLVPACSTALLSVALAATSISAVAQQRAPLVLEEVVVTATKTEELASNVAISANVATAADLQKANVVDFTEISKLAPGLDFASTRDPISGAIKLRNVGSNSFEGGNDKAVAVFVDQFVQSVPNAVFSTLMDVERIEVLRGPQGTLYGKNAPAGVISITTRRPDYEGIGGYVKGTLSNYDTYSTEAALNVPVISDKLAIRVAGTMGESDGYYYNAALNEDNGDSNKKDSRIKILFNPTEDLTMLLAYRNANIESGVIANLWDGQVPNSAGFGPNGGAIISDSEKLKVYSGVPRYSDTDLMESDLTIEWDLGDYSLTSLTSYSEFDIGMAGGNSSYRTDDTILDNFSSTRQVTQELRVNSYALDDLEWLAGIFYSHVARDGATSLSTGLNLGGPSGGESWGYFGNAIYDINDLWKVSLGLRYNDERKSLVALTPFGTVSLDDNFYNTSGSLKIHYFATPDIMLYTALDSAYRSGDFNNFVAAFGNSSLINAFPEGPEFVDKYAAFGAEESESLEIGMKGKFLDGRARANVAYFYQVFHDYQTRSDPGNGAQRLAGRSIGDFVSAVTVTVDKLVTQGIEMDGQMLFTDNWSGSFGLTYAHAVTDEFSNRLCARGEAPTGQLYCPGNGMRLNDDPLWTGNVQVAYDNSWSGFDYTARFVANYKSAPTYDNGRGAVATWDDYNRSLVTLDANFSFSPTQKEWNASVWVKNLTDERQVAAEGGLAANRELVMGYAAYIPPRTYGVTAQYNF